MHYSEWLLLVSGIMEDTPLGQTVLVRKEKDSERLKKFSKGEHRIRNQWQKFRAEQKCNSGAVKPEEIADAFEKAFAKMFR